MLNLFFHSILRGGKLKLHLFYECYVHFGVLKGLDDGGVSWFGLQIEY